MNNLEQKLVQPEPVDVGLKIEDFLPIFGLKYYHDRVSEVGFPRNRKIDLQSLGTKELEELATIDRKRSINGLVLFYYNVLFGIGTGLGLYFVR